MLDPLFFLSRRRPTTFNKALALHRLEFAIGGLLALLALILVAVILLLFQASKLLKDADNRVGHFLSTVERQTDQLNHNAAVVAFQTITALNGTTGAANKTLDSATRTLDMTRLQVASLGLATNTAIHQITAPCTPGPCGTLADVNKTLGTARGTMGQVEIALHHETKNLDRLDQQEEELVADVHKTLVGVGADVDLAHNLMADPHIPELVSHVTASSATMAHMLETADQVETKATHTYLHPSHNPLVRGFGYVSPFLVPGAQIAAAVR